MRLRRNQVCPIHRSRFCCGREVVPKVQAVRQLGIRRVEDQSHPRGYRELRSNGEMRKLLDRKIVSQGGNCGICGAKFTDYGDVVPDHISPRGLGGAWRDDHPDNIQAAHWWCNGEKGSTRI
jgi:5-methylcytosine-specific restriction endonuclease McrA